MPEVAIKLTIEHLDEGGYLATSPDVPGLIAEGRTVSEAVQIAQGLARILLDACLEHGDPIPPALQRLLPESGPIELTVPVGVS